MKKGLFRRTILNSFIAMTGAVLLLGSCGTVDGKSAGEIAGGVTGKVGGALGKTGDAISGVKDSAFDGLEERFGKDIADPAAGLDRGDILKELRPNTPSLRTDRYNEPSIPNISQLLINPKAPAVGKDKLITLNVTEDVPLKEVLVELARRADIDIELDPNIGGGIIFRAKERPFSEVIERITDLTGLRYSVKNGVLKVERDFPYVENYKVDFLNLTRSNSGGVNISTQVLTAGSGGSQGGGGSLSSGSNSSLQSEYEGDLWQSVESNITNILERFGTNSPGISDAAVVRDAGDDGLGEVLGEKQRATAASTVPGQPGQPNAPAFKPAQDQAPKVKAESASAADIIPSGSSLLSVNKQAGIIAVLANQRQHREVSKYLDHIRRQQSAQVLIEAKVVEVTLNEEYRSGIDWSVALNNLTKVPDFSIGSTFSADALTNTGGADNFFTLSLPTQELFGAKGFNLEGFVQFAEGFGITRTLSSPRISAINNQQAVLTFAQNLVYFEVEIQENNTTTTTGEASDLNISSTPRTVPLGVILNIQPSINLDTNEITMNVRPTLTRQKGIASDPAVALQAAREGVNISSDIPVIEVRELDSILKIKSGQVMVIGGLMEERVSNTDTGVPYLSKMPFTGNLFKKTSKNTEVVETVIFIKATIVPGFGVDPADKRLYRKFTNDRRPLTF